MFITAYGEKIKTPLFFEDKTRTKQAMKDETNINFIMDKFHKTGVIAHENKYEGQYGEFAAIDYHQAMNTVIRANEMFESVPSNIRKKFDNDPAQFLNFVTNEENRAEMEKMGLLEPTRPAEPEPSLEPPTEPPTPPAEPPAEPV